MARKKAKKAPAGGANVSRRRLAGRPSLYSDDMAQRICLKLAEGQSLREVCRGDPSLPSRGAILGWANDETHPFAPRYQRARQVGCWVHFDDLVDISDDGRNDWVERLGKEGESLGWTINGEAIARSKLRVDTRKWILSKMLPKMCGDKAAIEHSGPRGAPIEIEAVSKLDLARFIAHVLTGKLDEPE